MKKDLLTLITLSLIAFSCNKDKDNNLAKGVTRQDVLEIAKKYNLQDSLSEGYKPRYGNIPLEYWYPQITRDQLESGFAHWRATADSMNEFLEFIQERKKVTTLDAYFALMERYPIFYKEQVTSHGGIEGYKRWQAQLRTEFNVYLDKDGVLTGLPYNDDDGTFEGTLLHKALKR